MSKHSSSVIKLTDKDGNVINTTSNGTFTSVTVPGQPPRPFTIGPGTYEVNGTFQNLVPEKIYSIGSEKIGSRNISTTDSVTDKQWMSLLRKHIQLYMTDKELTDFLMEDALKEK